MPQGDETIDYSRTAHWLDEQAARGRRVDEPPGPPHDGDMIEQRVAALEADMKEVKADLKAMAKDVHEIKGRLSQMPTTFQMLTWFVGIALGLTGLVFTIARTMATH